MAHLATLAAAVARLAPAMDPLVEADDIAWSTDIPALHNLLVSLAAVLERQDAEDFVLEQEERAM